MNVEEVKTISSVSRDSRDPNWGLSASHLQKRNWTFGGWKFHSHIGWFDNVVGELGVRSIRPLGSRLHLWDELHLVWRIVMEHIQSKRDCVPGVTAIYFVEPTEQNVSLILDVSGTSTAWAIGFHRNQIVCWSRELYRQVWLYTLR